ncbi:MAG: 16S rRNA (uracil(1498)-N(3))-methyltransferase [Acidobacteria bacterium]|nr:16S rRNA (uracil(1498)-N(3))-methyltransferase [Acidobacteriota bacterium]
MSHRRRFFVPAGRIKGKKAFLSEDERHHLADVLRIKEGEEIFLFTEDGVEYRARILSTKPHHAEAEIVEEIPPRLTDPKVKIYLIIGVLKGKGLELVVRRGTELGISSFVPVFSARTIVRGLTNVDRLRKIAIEAAKQSGKRTVPDVSLPVSFSELDLSSFPGLKIILDEKAPKRLREVLPNRDEVEEVTVMVGPEGGWSRDEVREASNYGFIPVGLGERILRSETAALAISAIIGYYFGDLG